MAAVVVALAASIVIANVALCRTIGVIGAVSMLLRLVWAVVGRQGVTVGRSTMLVSRGMRCVVVVVAVIVVKTMTV